MNERLKNAFDSLDIDDKRNEISKELMIITELIRDSENILGIDDNINKAKNYNLSKDSWMEEKDILTYFYEDIYSIRNELTLLNLLINNLRNK